MSQSESQANGLSVQAAIAAKRAVRRYSAEAVPQEIINSILNAGRRAQSSKNDQPWVFVVVQEREQLQRLATAGTYAAHMPASAFTVVLVAPERYEFDLGQAAANMQLAGVAHGVGSCVTVLHNQDAARAILGVPAELSCRWAITFGYPAEPPAPLKAGGRRALDEIVRAERYS
jgi:nitroreductase